VLENKSDILSAWIVLKTHLKNEHAPWKFAFVKTDEESVYNSAAWDRHCKDSELEHELSDRYRHEQNGRIERAMQSIGGPFHCMMTQACCPSSDTADCLRHANVIRNNSPSRTNNGLTPREKVANIKLILNKRLACSKGRSGASALHMFTRKSEENTSHVASPQFILIMMKRTTPTWQKNASLEESTIRPT
jgi:hypothetical protein